MTMKWTFGKMQTAPSIFPDPIEHQAVVLGYEVERQAREESQQRIRELAIALAISIAINIIAVIWSLS
jgi:hypothetical protein